MSTKWIYRVGVTLKEINDFLKIELNQESVEKLLLKGSFKYKYISTEEALKEHIDETIGKPYKYNTSMRDDAPEIFSCSSLVSYLYVFAGIWMPSLVIDKFFYFKTINKEDLRFGDVVFSYNEDEHPLRMTSIEYMPGKFKTDKKVNHIGMYLGENKIIQASGLWYKGQVLIENLEESPSFKNVVGYGRVIEDLSEKRFVIEIPDKRPEIRNKPSLLEEIKKLWQTS